MRNFKILLWIFIIFLLQTVVLARVHILGAIPSLVLPYVICVMILENEFTTASVIGVICAAAAGALCGRPFSATVLIYVFASLIVFALRKKPRYITNPVKAVFWTFITSGVTEIIFYAVENMTVTTGMLLYDALLTAAINAVLALVIYPVLKRTMYKEEKKKLLIGDLV